MILSHFASQQSASASPSTPKRPLSRPFSAKTAADNRSRDVAPRKTKSAETHPSRKTPDSPALRSAALSAARSRDNRVTPKKLVRRDKCALFVFFFLGGSGCCGQGKLNCKCEILASRK